MGVRGSVPGLCDSIAHTHLTSRRLVQHSILLCSPPLPRQRASVCVSVVLAPRRASQMLLALKVTPVDVSYRDFPITFAGAGNHVNNLGNGAR